MDKLSLENRHARDSRITFDPIPHKYTIDKNPDVEYTSVTTWTHTHFKEFNADEIISNMMKRANWKNSVYYGMTPKQIKATWDEKRDEAAEAGTLLHYLIECKYNDYKHPMLTSEPIPLDVQYFIKFYNDHTSLVSPYRTEWTIFHEELQISGSIDMVFKNINDGSYSIYDWKRCKDIKKTSFFNECATSHQISHLPDSNYWHYCVQLNTYKAILEDKYGMKIRDMYLICLHPNNLNKSYLKIKVVDIQTEIQSLFDERKERLQKKNKYDFIDYKIN